MCEEEQQKKSINITVLLQELLYRMDLVPRIGSMTVANRVLQHHCSSCNEAEGKKEARISAVGPIKLSAMPPLLADVVFGADSWPFVVKSSSVIRNGKASLKSLVGTESSMQTAMISL